MSLYEDTKPIQKNRIVPVIKPNDYLEILQAQNKNNEEAQNAIYEQYNEDLIIVYMQDTEYSLSSINMESFEKLGIEKDKLLDFSIKT